MSESVTKELDPTQFAGDLGSVTDIVERWLERRRSGEWTSTFEIIDELSDPERFAFDLNETRNYNNDITAWDAPSELIAIAKADFKRRKMGAEIGHVASNVVYLHGVVRDRDKLESTPHIDGGGDGSDNVDAPHIFYLAATGTGPVGYVGDVRIEDIHGPQLIRPAAIAKMQEVPLPAGKVIAADWGFVHRSPSFEDVAGQHRSLGIARFPLRNYLDKVAAE